ncbi:MAG TPA: NnrU family protein [Rhizomicrobium sp.]|nr:NnrU family protein [Rhizomicrobium sp.]
MTMLIAAAAAFLALHLLVAGTKLRDAITGTIGERPYLGLFSLASIGIIIWLVMAYNAGSVSPDNRVLYDSGHVRDAGIAIVALAFFLGVQGLLLPNPTSVQQEGMVTKPGTVKGVLRITRHPFLWGVILWSGFHLAANGDLASVILFGTFFVLALFGTFSIDAKRKRKLGEAWADFAHQTSNIPFAAVLGGRTQLRLGESFGWRFLVAALVFLAILFSHARLFGVSPFPTGWVPF